jgi:hypothetical protein
MIPSIDIAQIASGESDRDATARSAKRRVPGASLRASSFVSIFASFSA